MTAGNAVPRGDPSTLFAGDGEMAALMRSLDWPATSLGPIGGWPTSLQTAVRICLRSGFPMAICWGRSYVLLYNDAARGILGTKHPWALGRPCFEVWAELAHIVRPMFDGVRETGVATWSDDLMLPLLRHGYLEEAYFTLSYSAIPGDANEPQGILVTVAETTERVLNERRFQLVRELGEVSGSVRTTAGAAERAGEILARHPADAPFALLYMIDDAAREARLAAAAGVQPGDRAAPGTVSLEEAGAQPWPLARAMAGGEPIVVDDLTALGSRPGDAWPGSARAAVLLAIPRPGRAAPIAVLVCGVNPRRALDGPYVELFRLVAGQIGNALANAIAHEEITEQIRRSEAAFRHATALREEFLVVASHELRTPLTTLGLQAETLARSLREVPPSAASIDRWARKAERLHGQAVRLAQLIEVMLDGLGLGRADLALAPEECDLAAVARAVVERLAGESKQAKASLRLRAEPVPGRWDRQRVEQILTLLVSNALKFGAEQPIDVVVAPAGERARICVRDRGIGIAPEDQERIFGRFERAASSEHFGGLGLGLWITCELVKAMGGTLRVESSPGHGATFVVELPRRP